MSVLVALPVTTLVLGLVLRQTGFQAEIQTIRRHLHLPTLKIHRKRQTQAGDRDFGLVLPPLH